MMLPTSIPFVYGNTTVAAGDVAVFDPGPVPDPFARLVAIYKSNAVLVTELDAVHARLSRAKEYRDSPGANLPLAEAHLLRLRARHSAVLTLLRANRVEARALLAHTSGLAGGECVELSR